MSYFNTTLKRNSKLDLSRSDLLKLVAMLEGELQAREIVIAVLKSEQIKKLLNPLKLPLTTSGFKTVNSLSTYGSKSIDLNPDQTIKYSADPLSALSRDSFAVYEPTFDYSTTLALYNLKMYELEKLINNQNQLRNKINEQLKSVEMRYESAFKELQEEKAKTKRMECEYQEYDKVKLKEEIDSLTKTLEENKNREKQIILSLLAERKHLIIKLIEERHQNEELKQSLTSEKGKVAEMVEGLEDESKRSLQMEAEIEKCLEEFETERNHYKSQIQLNESKNNELMNEIDKLKATVENLQKQLSLLTSKNIENIDSDKWNIGEGVRSSIVTMPVSSKVHSLSSVSPVAHPKASVAQPVTKNIPSSNSIKSCKTEDNSSSIESKLNIILPPPSIPVPQPKQNIATLKKSSSQSSTSDQFKAITNKPIEPSITNNETTETTKPDVSKTDNSVKQTVMFYENSANQRKQSSTANSTNNLQTATMRKAIPGARVPPPIPPNKPSIKPVLPTQAILQSKLKDANLMKTAANSQAKVILNSNTQNMSSNNQKS